MDIIADPQGVAEDKGLGDARDRECWKFGCRRHLADMPWEGVVELTQVLDFALPAYGGSSLREATDRIMKLPSEAATVAALCDSLGRNPDVLFREPVRLTMADPDDWDEQDEKLFGPWAPRPRVANGMHRITAAWILSSECIKVTSAPPPARASDEIVVVNCQPMFFLPGFLEDADVLEACFDWLRSFPLTADTWVESACMSSSDSVVELIYSCSHRLAGLLRAKLHQRATENGFRLMSLRARETTWTELLGE